MSALTDFLLARIDEDERTAGWATPAPWVHVPAGGGTDRWNVEARGAGVAHRDVAVDRAGGACARADAAHIAHWDPARVIAECDARRRIVQLQQSDLRDDPQDWEADEVLRLLALPYADHPDYRRAWRPYGRP
jgi:hypothetical protein